MQDDLWSILSKFPAVARDLLQFELANCQEEVLSGSDYVSKSDFDRAIILIDELMAKVVLLENKIKDLEENNK